MNEDEWKIVFSFVPFYELWNIQYTNTLFYNIINPILKENIPSINQLWKKVFSFVPLGSLWCVPYVCKGFYSLTRDLLKNKLITSKEVISECANSNSMSLLDYWNSLGYDIYSCDIMSIALSNHPGRHIFIAWMSNYGYNY